nr:MAG TPA: Inorganic pyrophosphatase [Caudoviricetes sp.]
MILFTDLPHKDLDLVRVDVIGAVRTVDNGEQDDKIICVETDCNLKSVRKQMKKTMKFLKTYKGKDADMKIDKKLASMEEADKLVEAAHQEYEELKLKQLAVSKTGIQRRSKVIIGR